MRKSNDRLGTSVRQWARIPKITGAHKHDRRTILVPYLVSDGFSNSTATLVVTVKPATS
jgi:hypothetical protein